jgi:hypothetical protein
MSSRKYFGLTIVKEYGAMSKLMVPKSMDPDLVLFAKNVGIGLVWFPWDSEGPLPSRRQPHDLVLLLPALSLYIIFNDFPVIIFGEYKYL